MTTPPRTRSSGGRLRLARALTALAVAGVTTALAGCGAESDEADGPVTLEFWTYSLKAADPAAQAIIERYEEEHPGVTIELSEVGGTAETSSKLLAADRADDVPDLVQVEYRALPSLVVSGAVRDITDDVADVRENVDENIWALNSVDDRVYGVPQDIGPMMLTYRADLFEQYGVEVPTTWEEYAEAAETIHEQDPDVYIASFSASQFEFFAAQAAQAGSRWWNADDEGWTVGIADEASLQTADFWQDLVERDLVSVEPLLTPEWNAKVNDGRILSWAAAAWAPSVLYSVAPDTAGQWAAAPLPQWTPGDPAVPFQGGSTYLVPEKSEHAEEAAEFAAWLGASDEGSELLLDLDLYPGGNGGREATLSSDPPRLMPEQTDFYAMADQVIQDTTIPMTWGPNVNVAQSAFSDALNQAALDGTSFRDVYTATQEAVIEDLEDSGYPVRR
ncbi:ABC transporter substrate-binding protein [Streptomyces millisiae]|uniref:Extracellular solute-binding protein n=1 Tax=Streptomyces millisiae TaxID=3075542 RepID=A0ABU2LSP1_9ACTN|nr:extracellular solute-binding protein [Streptomyces sp. DSM 44918]MDT0320605.1 extracellular solute-binding protein [Streptomyces sp. DSM 44918]